MVDQYATPETNMQTVDTCNFYTYFKYYKCSLTLDPPPPPQTHMHT